jgi:hypothetical protein
VSHLLLRAEQVCPPHPAVLPAVFLWRNMGGALLTLLPAVTYSLKVRHRQQRRQQ